MQDGVVEQLQTPILIVGAGPAGLACALRLAQLIRETSGTSLTPGDIHVIDKADSPGMHTLSGAIMDPVALSELIPDYRERECPLDAPVSAERLLFLTGDRSVRVPLAGHIHGNSGCYLISLGKLTQWLAAQVEQEGVNVLCGFAGSELLVEQGCVAGVRTGDRGRDRTGRPGPSFEAGVELRAGITILAEGACGSLTRALLRIFPGMTGSNPQAYSLGMKELWEIPSGRLTPGTVMHTAGYPLGRSMSGGGWMYAMRDNRLSLGLVVGLSYSDPGFVTHTALQHYKLHPLVRSILRDGRLLRYGAKTIATGGLWSLPSAGAPGAMVIGDAAGFVDTRRMKGIHTAIKSGMLAAEVAFDALAGGGRDADLQGALMDAVRRSWMWNPLWKARNFHQAISKGLADGMFHLGLQMLTRGRGLHRQYPDRAPHEYLRPGDISPAPPSVQDDGIVFSRETSVHYSGTDHDASQPCHLVVPDPEICAGRCTAEFGNPCRNFCPAGVYELTRAGDAAAIRINAGNCLHCKTCEIMDPYRNIRWIPPETGGPRYEAM